MSAVKKGKTTVDVIIAFDRELNELSVGYIKALAECGMHHTEIAHQTIDAHLSKAIAAAMGDLLKGGTATKEEIKSYVNSHLERLVNDMEPPRLKIITGGRR